jgi:hypothetical protein
MSEFKIELVSKLGGSVIGAAIDAESALKVMDEAMRLCRTGHIAGPRSALNGCRHGSSEGDPEHAKSPAIVISLMVVPWHVDHSDQ